jgi:hypothetical protein
VKQAQAARPDDAGGFLSNFNQTRSSPHHCSYSKMAIFAFVSFVARSLLIIFSSKPSLAFLARVIIFFYPCSKIPAKTKQPKKKPRLFILLFMIETILLFFGGFFFLFCLFAEVLWRLARVSYMLAAQHPDNSDIKKKLTLDAADSAIRSAEINPNSSLTNKVCPPFFSEQNPF